MSESSSRKAKGLSRRKFLVRSSIGVGVLLGTGYLSQGLARRYLAEYMNTAEVPFTNSAAPQLWFEITSNNQVILHSPKVEMGQGIFTGLAQIAADELDVHIDQIKVVHAETFSGVIDTYATGGSTSTSKLWQPLRELAATMREMIKAEAAKIFNTDVQTLSVANGMIQFGDRSLTYGEVVQQVREWTVPDVPPLKPITEYKFIGQPVTRVDLKDKVMGVPIFGMDASMPDMLYGAVVRPDKIGARFVDADTALAESMPDVVKVVKEEDFVGVVATSYIAAERAKQAIKVTWEIDRTWQSEDIEAMIKVGRGTPVEIQRIGKPDLFFDEPGNIIEAEYSSPIGAHAQLEPNGALAFVEADKATVVISTQVAKLTRKEVAERLGLDVDQVNIKPTYLGGGFGRRLHTPNAVQAAVLSRAVGKPVKCFFDRKEEFQHDAFRPPTHHVLKAKLSNNGTIEAISHNISSGDVMFGFPLFPAISAPLLGADAGAWRGGMIQYRDIPNIQAVSWRVKLPFATSWWRSLGLFANTFAIEGFMDELAIIAGKDPVQFRLDHIQDDAPGRRLKAVIKTAAEQANYTNEVMNARAMGFAASTDGLTPVAQIAEVSIEANQIKVHKVTCVIDPGLAVNPDQIRAQCEGSIIMGLSAALYEKMYVKDGALYPTTYGPYKMALMRDAPREIDVVILESGDKPASVGEPPMGPIGAAIANAVYRLTKQRLRSMPLELA